MAQGIWERKPIYKDRLSPHKVSGCERGNNSW
jgi:hypothetical protein